MNKIFAAALIAATSVVQATFDKSNSDEFPSLNVEVNDEKITLQVQSPLWSQRAKTDGSRLIYPSETRNYLSWADKIDPDSYLTLNMLGGAIQYDVDMSQVDCGCTSYIYAMPIPGQDNEVDPFNGCDGSGSEQQCPKQFNIMSANNFAFQVSANSEKLNTDFPCASHVHASGDIFAYGFGENYTINTAMPFHVRTEFHELDGLFTGYTTTLMQHENQVVMKSNCPHLFLMTEEMKQMTFVLSHYALDNNDQLNRGVCYSTCDKESSHSKIANLAFYSRDPLRSAAPADEKEDDAVWMYGDACDNLADGLCADVDCKSCKWSWPSDSEYTDPENNDPRSDCRCEEEL